MEIEDSRNYSDSIPAAMDIEMSMEQCKKILAPFKPLTEIIIARILGYIVQANDGTEDCQSTYSTSYSTLDSDSLSGLPVLDSWNLKVLTDSMKQLVSSILDFFLDNFCGHQ